MNPTRSPRLPLVDVLRGFAVAQMIVYHFIYDLDHFGYVQLAMTRDQPWLGWRTLIVTQFLLLVGVSLVLRLAHQPGWRDFGWRWAQVAAAAALVSAGSWLMFGPRFIYIGILHFIALALLIARPLAPLRQWNLLLAAAAFAAWWLYRDPAFNPAPANIVGFVTIKPRTEDYVPLFPWLAAVFAGVGLGSLWQRRGFALAPSWQRLNARPPRLLVLLGTWALTVYLLHQPVMIGMLWLVSRLA
ncbi:MAG: DUF1624 domain-containing protein [Burkholderiales bacterium]|nr:MAG: DUF1624 domain-containing protein [Burkholderiales bacterium]